MFPILEENENPHLMIHGRDYSPRAIEVLLADPQFDPLHATAEVWDIASDSLPGGILENSVDVITLCFVLSALVFPFLSLRLTIRNHDNGNKQSQIYTDY